MPDVCLAAFDPDRDIPMLVTWLARPHVAQWWGDPAKALAASQRYPAANQALIRVGTRPVGYACWGTPSPEELVSAGLDDLPTDLVDVDILIGEPDARGLGVGPAALRQLVARLHAGGARVVGLAASAANLRALQAYHKAGFREHRDFQEEGQDMKYLVHTPGDQETS